MNMSLKTRVLTAIACVSMLAASNQAEAQGGPRGWAPTPDDLQGSSATDDFYRHLSDTMRGQHTLDRAAKYWDWFRGDKSILLRATSKALTVYNSASSWTGKNCVTPVRDQNPCGSCWAHASTATLESAHCIETGVGRDLAEQTLLECRVSKNPVLDAINPPPPSWRCTNGNNIGEAYNIMRGRGLDTELRRPWALDGVTYAACPSVTALTAFTTRYGVDAVNWVKRIEGGWQPTPADIKAAIVDDGAVTVGIVWTPRFDSTAAGTAIVTQNVDMVDRFPSTDGHVVSIVGWSDTLSAWRIKNSWGTTSPWGRKDGGFAWLSYGDISIQGGSFSSVSPRTKGFDFLTSVRLFTDLAIKISLRPNIWLENPLVQFPPSLGFPTTPQRVVEGFQWAIANGLLSAGLVANWPGYARDRLQ